MEVNRVSKLSNMNKLGSKENVAKESISFQSVMNKKNGEQSLQLFQEKILEIEEQGEKLAENCTVESLKKYKKLVKEFLNYAVDNGLELQEHFGFNLHGSSRIHKVVKEVNKKLIDLTNEVLQKESNGLNVLNLVGEIKGLIINIYT